MKVSALQPGNDYMTFCDDCFQQQKNVLKYAHLDPKMFHSFKFERNMDILEALIKQAKTICTNTWH